MWLVYGTLKDKTMADLNTKEFQDFLETNNLTKETYAQMSPAESWD